MRFPWSWGWMARRRARKEQRNLAGWDNPATGHDLLAAMLEAKKRKEHPLP